jgi:mannose-1-phosphate guanylyltransferase
MTSPSSSFHRVCIIMAGGSGERFWPLSRPSRPKQLLSLTRPDMNLLEVTVDRIAPLVQPPSIFIATAPHLRAPIESGQTGVPLANILTEPHKRNTAGCLTWVAASLLARFPGEEHKVSMSILTADHAIPDLEAFRKDVTALMSHVETHDSLGVIGVPPTRPETGYGYIELAEPPRSSSNRAECIAPVVRFREKPDLPTATAFHASGRHFWNSGMFFWRLSSFLHAMKLASPIHELAARSIAQALASGDTKRANHIFAGLPDVSIDVALMEKAQDVVMMPASFAWDDIGAWDALGRLHSPDAAGNVNVGQAVLHDCRQCVVLNEPGPDEMAVAVVGMEGVTVVVTRDAVLVMPTERAQDVRAAVRELRQRGAPQV